MSKVSREVSLFPPQQFRQPRDIDGDPVRLVGREYLGLRRLCLSCVRVDVGERLSVRVAHDVT